MDVSKSSDYQIRCIVAEILKGNNVILHGPGGTGKSYTINNIVSALLAYEKIVSCTATTGIAALNISEKKAATTLHSWAGVGLASGDAQALISKVRTNKKAVSRWINTQVFIIDEISMLGADFFDKLNIIGRTIRRNDKPFGGITLVLSGDFLQLPPVKDGWTFDSKVWKELHLIPFIFKEPKRYDDTQYFDFLLRVREGNHNLTDIKMMKTRCQVYKKLQEYLKTANQVNVIKPTILYSLKADVDSYNKDELDKLEGEEIEYVAVDNFVGDNSKVEDYKKLLDEAMPEKIVLKAGAQVMLKVNLDVELGLVNGSRGVILEINKHFVYVRFINGMKLNVTPYCWKVEDKHGTATRTQMPFILAYSLTYHKTQGCTLDYAVCDLGSTVFSDGQAYVGLSRVRNLKSLFISSFYDRCITTNKKALIYAKELESHVCDITPIPQEEWDFVMGCGEKKKFSWDGEEVDISVEITDMLGKLGIDTKEEWKNWLLKNHPDKGGEMEMCKVVISEGKKKGW